MDISEKVVVLFFSTSKPMDSELSETHELENLRRGEGGKGAARQGYIENCFYVYFLLQNILDFWFDFFTDTGTGASGAMPTVYFRVKQREQEQSFIYPYCFSSFIILFV